MRYHEIAAIPVTPDEAKNKIQDIVTVYSGRNESKIPMSTIVDTLHGEGFDITPSIIMDVLRGNQAIKKIGKDTIYLKGDEAELGMIPDDEKEKSEKHVQKMAKKAVKKGTRKP